MSQSFFEISGEIIACELDETERLYGRPSPRILSSFIRESSASGATRSTTDDIIVADNDPHSLESFSKWQMLGRGMAGAGAAILMTPDPVPVIDEVIGAG
ncbi:hypothetical protein OAE12_01570, partial [bacterium]|nr:hypothetical protein [bacterium]